MLGNCIPRKGNLHVCPAWLTQPRKVLDRPRSSGFGGRSERIAGFRPPRQRAYLPSGEKRPGEKRRLNSSGSNGSLGSGFAGGWPAPGGGVSARRLGAGSSGVLPGRVGSGDAVWGGSAARLRRAVRGRLQQNPVSVRRLDPAGRRSARRLPGGPKRRSARAAGRLVCRRWRP